MTESKEKHVATMGSDFPISLTAEACQLYPAQTFSLAEPHRVPNSSDLEPWIENFLAEPLLLESQAPIAGSMYDSQNRQRHLIFPILGSSLHKSRSSYLFVYLLLSGRRTSRHSPMRSMLGTSNSKGSQHDPLPAVDQPTL